MKTKFFFFATVILLSLAACGGEDMWNPSDDPDDPVDSSEMWITSCDDNRAEWLVGMHIMCNHDEKGDGTDPGSRREAIISLKQLDPVCRVITDPDRFKGVIFTRPPKNISELLTIPGGHKNAIVTVPGSGLLEFFYRHSVKDPPDDPPKKFTCSIW